MAKSMFMGATALLMLLAFQNSVLVGLLVTFSFLALGVLYVFWVIPPNPDNRSRRRIRPF